MTFCEQMRELQSAWLEFVGECMKCEPFVSLQKLVGWLSSKLKKLSQKERS